MLDVEAKRTVENVGDVEPAERDQLHHPAGGRKVDDQGQSETKVFGLVVVWLLQHEHAHQINLLYKCGSCFFA